MGALSLHLETRRSQTLEAWHHLVCVDSDLTTASQLSRTLFIDHIPEILESYGCRLVTWPDAADPRVEQQESSGTTGHGLHRWQQGFRLRELTVEWSYLQRSVMDEIEAYSTSQPVDAGVVLVAMRLWSQLCMAGVSDSANQFWQLQQEEAAGHIHDLEEARDALAQIEKTRSAEWHRAAHDLRGGLSVVTMATALLHGGKLEESGRLQSTDILQRSVNSLQEMLNNLIGLARLGAGRETRDIVRFDASIFLRDFCDMTQSVAQAKGLYLWAEGPASLEVEGDKVKIQRILQNLVLNSIKYTERGGIALKWEMSHETDGSRWMVSVQDTGPGLSGDQSAPMSKRLQEATLQSHEIEHHAVFEGTSSNSDQSAKTVFSQSPAQRPETRSPEQMGEGIGLSIVKGLCDLLDATIEVESGLGQGSTFRVTFPVSYSKRTDV